jgi:hypothetical protein
MDFSSDNRKFQNLLLEMAEEEMRPAASSNRWIVHPARPEGLVLSRASLPPAAVHVRENEWE